MGFIARRPVISLILGLLGWAALLGGMSGIKANFTHTAFFFDDDPLLKRFNRFERQFGNDDAIVVVVHSPSGIFDLSSATLLQRLTDKMWKVSEVIRVDSLANFNWVHANGDEIEVEPLIPDDQPLTAAILAARRKVALEHASLPDYLISRDGKTALVYARIKPGIERPPNAAKIVAETRAVVASLAGGDHRFHITGNPAINNAFKEVSQKDIKTLIPVVLGLTVLFLGLLLRKIGGVALPIVVVVLSVVGALAIAGLLGIELTSATAILPQALIAIGIADAVHILSTFYRARSSGLEKREAAVHALEKNFLPTILTSVSTAAGFYAFVTANLKPISGVGVLAGTGTLLAWFLSYFVMGALLFLLPSWQRRATARRTPQSTEHDTLHAASPFAQRVTERLYHLRWPIIVAVALLCVGTATVTATNSVNSDPYKYFDKGYPLRDAQDFIMDNLGGVLAFEMSVSAGKTDGIKDPDFMKRVERFEGAMKKAPGVTKAVSIVDIIRQTNRSLHADEERYYRLPNTQQAIAQMLLLYTMSLPQGMDVNDRITVKNDALRLSVISTISDSVSWVNTAERFEKMGQELGLDVKVTGKTMLYRKMNGYVVSSFITSLGLAVLLISLLLVIFFRSLRLGAIALLPNLIPLLCGGAMLRAMGGYLDIGTVLVASVCLGIAVDNNIHILANFRRYREQGVAPREAIARVLTHTAPALIVTTCVLVVGFGTLAFATFVPNIYFGILTATILGMALLIDLTFLPALLLVLEGRRDASEAETGASELAADPT